jgi:hypothetical protein
MLNAVFVLRPPEQLEVIAKMKVSPDDFFLSLFLFS